MSSISKRHWLSRRVCVISATLLVVAIAAAWTTLSRTLNIDSATLAQLQVAADELSEHRAGMVDKSAWPAAIAKFTPNSVRVSKDGVYVELHSFFVEEDGIFLQSTRSSFQPTEKGDPTYRPLGKRVYWYEIKG